MICLGKEALSFLESRGEVLGGCGGGGGRKGSVVELCFIFVYDLFWATVLLPDG